MKFLKSVSPYLYVMMVVFVVFHNTGYQLKRMIEVPYVLYLLLALLGFMVIKSIIKESTTTD